MAKASVGRTVHYYEVQKSDDGECVSRGPLVALVSGVNEDGSADLAVWGGEKYPKWEHVPQVREQGTPGASEMWWTWPPRAGE